MESFRGELGFAVAVLLFMCVCMGPSSKITVCSQESVDDYPLVDEEHRPCVEAVVHLHVLEAVRCEKRMAASLLRLHFHDCFVGGCDASLLLDGPDSEKIARGNNNSVRGFELVDLLKESITSECRVRISCADILALAARSGIQAVSPLHLLPTWRVPFGRYDSKIPYANRTGDLPGTDDSMPILVKKFAKQNIKEVQQVVALIGGGHTIGANHCSFVKRRLYGNNTSSLHSDPSYVEFLERQCPEEGSENENDVLIALDNTTENIFDSGFFLSLSKGRVSIKSDQLLGDPQNDVEIRKAVKTFTENEPQFFITFGFAMENMGSNGVLGEDQGEIRTNCRYPNGHE